MVMLWQAALASDCVLSGFCVLAERVGPPPGLMYLAVGFVLAGGAGLAREWRGRRPESLNRSGPPERAD